MIQQHLDQLEQAGIIRKGVSAWAANVVRIVRRVASSDEIKFRLMTDMRKINTAILECKQPLPHAEREILNLRGWSILSQLDFKAAFFAIRLSKASQKIFYRYAQNDNSTYSTECVLAVCRRLRCTPIL